MHTPEKHARETIDAKLTEASCVVESHEYLGTCPRCGTETDKRPGKK